MFDEREALAALDRLREAVDALLGLSLPGACDEFVLQALQAVQVQVNRLGAVDAALVGEAEGRRLWFGRACGSTAQLLVQLLRIDPAQAKARVAAAVELGPRRSLTGEVLDPIYPTVADAMRDGEIGTRHAAIITRTVEALPAAVAAEHDRAVESLLVDHARQHTPAVLAKIARRVTDTLDPDGTLSDESDRQRRRYLDVTQRPDGSAAVRGELDAVCTEALLTVLDPLARPEPAEDGHRDPRTPGQRRHDGLRDGLLAALRAGQLPDSGGITTTILVTITADQLHTNTGLARTGHGAVVPVPTITRELLPDAQLMPITLSRNHHRDDDPNRPNRPLDGQPENPCRGGIDSGGIDSAGIDSAGIDSAGIDSTRIEGYGPARRLFTASQRLAMAARDGGCSFPGCTVPASWCQAHHVIAWIDGGPTTTDNGTLLCGFHHRHFDDLGWTCAMHDGTPRWTPPPWLDRHQQPTRNSAHDPVPAPLAPSAVRAADAGS